jgi:hypothetical protein
MPRETPGPAALSLFLLSLRVTRPKGDSDEHETCRSRDESRTGELLTRRASKDLPVTRQISEDELLTRPDFRLPLSR